MKLLFGAFFVFLAATSALADQQVCVRASDGKIVVRKKCKAPKFTRLATLDELKGEKGDKGDRGDAGPYISTLPSGQTLSGVYAFGGPADAPSQMFFGGIAFVIPLEAPPAVEVFEAGEAATEHCSGSATAPTAAPGYLCVYEYNASTVRQAGSLQAYDFQFPLVVGRNAATASGATLWIRSNGAGSTYSEGAWAVTAP